MKFEDSLKYRGLFRFTGPPEHWLTAVKFMTWGLEEKHKNKWEKLQPGDVFFIHSTGPQTSFFNNARSGIIGLGVIGPDFSVKENFLWLYETQNKVNRWPLLVPMSEIYLFSELPPVATWNNPDPDNIVATKTLIDVLLRNCVPLSKVEGFPQMGSFSSVSTQVARQILNDKKPLYLYSGLDRGEREVVSTPQNRLEEIKTATEAMRYADTLRVFDSVKARVVNEPKSAYLRDNDLLARAEDVHATILQQLIDLFRSKGYATRSNRFVDLFAHNKERAFLFDVKSTENMNFRPRARKGIAQLFEYDYFEVQRFADENQLAFNERHKIIVPSRNPTDDKYVEFINSLKIGVARIENNQLKPVGKDLGFSKI